MFASRIQPSETPLTRRELLCRLGAGFGAVGLAGLLAGDAPAAEKPGPLSPRKPHFTPKARRVIFLFMNGGPSHVDTFDPKPALERFAGKDPPTGPTRKAGKLMPSPFKFHKYGEAGIEVSDLFPEVGRCIDDICVIRSMVTDSPAHERALLLMNSGNMQPIRPSLGSWLCYGLGTENQNLPGFLVLCPGKPVVGPQLWSSSFLPGVYQGAHVNNKAELRKPLIRFLETPHLTRDDQRRQLDLLREMNQIHLDGRGPDRQLEARIHAMEVAFRMQTEATDAFDLSRETAETRARYGDGEFADACLLARRLAERGVRMTQIYFGADQPWDDHKDITNHRKHAVRSDRAIAALLRDLAARGLLDDTLVVWGGEFGRTPTSEGARGRDHHNKGFSMWLAGGGVKGGMTYGATDELGLEAVQDSVHVHDLHATILHLLGIDHEKLTYRYSGRDFRLTDVSGVVIDDILT